MANDLRAAVGEDRISNVPDKILGLILSSIPTKEGMRTSVLSKRWRYVWTSVPCIEIHDLPSLSKYRKRPKTTPKFNKASFQDFVGRVLRLNKVSCLRKFILSCNQEHGQCCFNEWIKALATRDAKIIYLNNEAGLGSEPEPRIELPPCLFNCKKLVILQLNHLFVLDAPVSVCLPSLKILRLYLVQFYDDNSLKNLLAGCPVLEELDIQRDYYEKTKTLHIQSSSLKSFRLYIDEAWDESNLGLVLHAKNLERLDLSDHVTEKFDVSSLSSLISVQLHLHHGYLPLPGGADVYIELLSKLCSTKYMQLSMLSMQSLEFTTLDKLPVFHNLTHLVVGIMGPSWPVLPYLLECSPNLITFDFSLDELPEDDLDEDGLHDDVHEVVFRMPKCLMLHLESIKIEGFCWSKNEMELVRYLLKSSMVLKKMVIYVETLRPEQSNLCKELFMFPKASTACELIIDSYKRSLKKLLPIS